MSNRNITLSLPDELVRRAEVVAAERDTSVSALVAAYLEGLTREEDDDQWWRDEQRLMAEGLAMRVGEVTWTRDEAHGR